MEMSQLYGAGGNSWGVGQNRPRVAQAVRQTRPDSEALDKPRGNFDLGQASSSCALRVWR